MVLRSLAALTVPLVLLVSSCSDDDPDPILAPSASPAPTSEQVSPTASEEPESAEEFIERWVKLNNQMQVSGNTDLYRAVSRECQPCQSFADQIDDIYGNGGFVRTQGWQIIAINGPEGSPKNPTHDVDLNSRPTTYAESEGAPTSKLAGGRITERFELHWEAGEWTIINMSQVAS